MELMRKAVAFFRLDQELNGGADVGWSALRTTWRPPLVDLGKLDEADALAGSPRWPGSNR